MVSSAFSAKFNGFGLKHYTIETEHFRINYEDGLEDMSKKVGSLLEGLYGIYANIYNLTLPSKTDVLVVNSGLGIAWALTIQNTILIDANSLDYNLRGTNNWLEDAVAHEFAHIASIWTSFKFPAWMPYIQIGYFSHPNSIHTIEKKNNDSTQIGARIEAMHIFPSEILPPWFFEGIAQYESLRNKGDRWDSHRDMVLRTLTMSNRLLTWDHMSVFTGKEDDFEKTYNHGFSLIKYISETHGYKKIVSILRESSKIGKLNFDKAIKASLGIDGKQLYNEWKDALKKEYTKQIEGIGTQVYGKKINKAGFDNYWPRFGPDNKIYFLSNGSHDFAFAFKKLYSYNLTDTVDTNKRIKMEMPSVTSFYNIHEQSRNITFTSRKSKKSILPPKKGGFRVLDIFIDTLPSEKKKKRLFARKTERQISEKKWFYQSVFSPSGKKLAFTQHVKTNFYLLMMDTSGKNITHLYPPKNNPELQLQTIFSIDWSPNKHDIAISYIDRDNRKIGIYNIQSKDFHILCDTEFDERDPRFSRDGRYIYFSSDRTGIFNIYRYCFETSALQRLTNVSGGAFSPDISKDEKKLVYSNYDPDGYGIYLIDSITILEEKILSSDSALKIRSALKQDNISTDISAPVKYSLLPRKALFIPTIFIEQILSENNNTYKGITQYKLGGILNINDPFEWHMRGSNIGCYFLSETLNPFKIFDFSGEIFNRSISYDFGFFANTKILPLDISLFYALRAIDGTDEFKVNDSIQHLKYNINPRVFEINLTHNFSGGRSFNLFTTFDRYKIWTYMTPNYYEYTPARGFRIGTYIASRRRNYDAKMNISPKGFFYKLKYEFWNQKLIDNEKAFKFEEENGSYTLKWNYDRFQYNQITGNLIYAKSTPWHKRHDYEISLNATALKLTDKCKKRLKKDKNESNFPELHPTDLPSFYKPSEWLPGYVFYYRDTAEVYTEMKDDNNQPIIDTSRLAVDTVLVSGNAVLSGSFSYRFPLWKGSIDKKLWFLYLDRFYGVLNFGGATAVDKLSDLNHLKRKDLLLWRGLELRLETISFNTYPLAISARWDYGIDKRAPIGGHKFTLKFGFSFDNWDIISEPDGKRFKPKLSL
jgi:Tol biopolymer transport system component